MSDAEQLHTLTIDYPPYEAGRSLTCVSVADFATYEPVDFREFLPQDKALQELQILSVGITREVLRLRKESFGETRTVPHMEAVISFLGNLAIQPFGKLSYVDNLTLFEQPIESPGVTSNLHRQSFIIDSNIKVHGDEKAIDPLATPLPPLPKDTLVEFIGVHELIHLAGVPEVAYFIVDRTRERAIQNLKHSPLVLEMPSKVDKGSFFEEGYATLGAYMYLWQKHPETMADTSTEPRRSPSGIEVSLPIRHAFYASPYAYMAWSIERLTDFSPRMWDILQGSRAYGVSSDEMRGELKREIDKLNPNLFALMDVTNVRDLDEVMRTSAIVDEVVRQAVGR